jgi:hypothetical protein
LPENTTQLNDSRKFPGIASLCVIYSYLYCMMLSNTLIGVPILGGSLFLLGRVAALFMRFGGRKSRKLLSRAVRLSVTLLIAAVFFAALLLAVIYPASLAVPISQVLVLAGIVFITILRETIIRKIKHACLESHCSKARTAIRIMELNILLFLLAAILVFPTQPMTMALYMLGGYVLGAVFEYGTLKGESIIQPPAGDAESVEVNGLSHVYAYRVFQKVTLFAAAALQVTLMLAFALSGYAANDLVYRIAAAAACIYVSRGATVRLLRSKKQKDTDPGIIMVTGIILWLLGLLLLARNIVMTSLPESYLSLILCACGVTASVTALENNVIEMRRVATFSLGHSPTPAYDFMRMMMLEYANLAGQALALFGLAMIFLYTRGSFPASLALLEKSLRPMLLLPALSLVILTLLTALRFPMTGGHIKKLRRFLQLKDNGETNLPLQRQLEDVIIKISRKHYGMKLLLSLIRPLYYHKILGRENVIIEDGSSAVFVCNHGELYGPVVANLYIPYDFKPWSISALTDHDELVDYMYQFTFIRQRWIIPCFKRPMALALAPIILWAIRSIECIAVYRDRPRELIRTFKITTAAMEAGDNILIFPENPRSVSQEKPGYMRDGIGEFYSGFTMLGPMYYEKTGKRVQFIPIYADKKRRTLTFGKPTRYNPDELPIPEKERIVKHLRDEMIAILNAGHTPVPSNNGVKA